VDFLVSGIFAAHFVNTVSPTFLDEVCEGQHAFLPGAFRRELLAKKMSGYALGILNAPDPFYNPTTDDLIACRYSGEYAAAGKLQNKRELQDRLGLIKDDQAPLLFWPSRLDPAQKGCQLLTQILYDLVSAYWKENLQVVFVANGPYQRHFHDIVRHHGILERVAVSDFEEGLSHLAYAASDFLLMPSLFEPCGLPQMIGAIYGSLPIVRDTGGLHDTIKMLDIERSSGNGFVFESFDAAGLRWAIDQALQFYHRPAEVKATQIARVMRESAARFTHSVSAREYIDLYETMLRRPIVKAV
jgi:starch synthase/alpha-amylase